MVRARTALHLETKAAQLKKRRRAILHLQPTRRQSLMVCSADPRLGSRSPYVSGGHYQPRTSHHQRYNATIGCLCSGQMFAARRVTVFSTRLETFMCWGHSRSCGIGVRTNANGLERFWLRSVLHGPLANSWRWLSPWPLQSQLPRFPLLWLYKRL